MHYLQIIGEACRSITPDFKSAHSEVSWRQIIGMRNILVHDYFGIDKDVVWGAVERDIPLLKERIQAYLQE